MSDTPAPADNFKSDLPYTAGYANPFGIGKYGVGPYGVSPNWLIDKTKFLWTRIKNALGALLLVAAAAGAAGAADTYTPTLNLRKPEVGVEDPNTQFGDKLNNNADIIDAATCDKRVGCAIAGPVSVTTLAVTGTTFTVAGTTVVVSGGLITASTTIVTGRLGVGNVNPATRLHVSTGGAILDGANSAITLAGMTAPTAVAGKLYFDSGTTLLRYSRDGSTFVDLATGSVSGNFINLQNTTPGAQQSGNENISGAALVGSSITAGGTLTVASSSTFKAGLGITGQATDANLLSVSSPNATAVLTASAFGVISSTTQPAARVIRTTDLNIDTGVNTEVSMSTIEYNQQLIYAVSAATAPSGGAGYYDVRCFVSWANNSSNRRVLNILLNGSVLTGGSDERAPLSGTETKLFASARPYLAAGDAVKCQVFQNSGSALAIKSAFMEIMKIW